MSMYLEVKKNEKNKYLPARNLKLHFWKSIHESTKMQALKL